jgi:hypothetical protein
LGCIHDYDKVYIYSKRDQLKDYFLHSATIEGVFEYIKDEDEDRIVGTPSIKDGELYYEVTVSYYNKTKEEFESKGFWIERSDFLLEVERESLVNHLLKNTLVWKVT